MATTSIPPEVARVAAPIAPARRPSFAIYVLILLAIGAAVGLASALFAGASAGAFDTRAINSGDTAWLLAAAALVMIMTPAVGFFYGGMVRSKNVVSVIKQSLLILCLVSVQWVVI